MFSKLPPHLQKILFLVLACSTLTPWISSAPALLLGVACALLMGNPWATETKKWTPLLLQASVVGLGASMNLDQVAEAGIQGFGYTWVTIVLTLVLGLVLGIALKTEATTSLLVSVGTAICGGSAIAAVAATVQAKSEQVSVALATVFLLNASALFIFPIVGKAYELSPHDFGLWSALAIHDTSSVVGAALHYSPLSVSIATTVKLARALWIVPVSLLIAWLWPRTFGDSTSASAGQKTKIKKPWFILGFLIAAALTTYLPFLQPAGLMINTIAKHTLILTLFLIGSGLTQATLKSVGPIPMLQGFLLWIASGSFSLFCLLKGWIH